MKIQKRTKKQIAEKATSNGLSIAQQKVKDKIRRIINDKGLTSQMNNTKWKKVIQVIQQIKGYAPRFRVRCLDQEKISENHWEGSFPHHVPIFRAIEWIEFKPDVEIWQGGLIPTKKINFKEKIVGALKQASVPIEITKTGIRIIAYAGSSDD